MRIICFSGGKDSTAMLLMMIEKGLAIDRVLFCDTGKEFPGMYNHIEKVADFTRAAGFEVETIKIDFDYWFCEHIKVKGKNKGGRGYGWPDFRNRWCTALKRDSIKRIKGSSGGDVIQFHGIAYDEKERCKNNSFRDIRYPLVEWGITEAEALQYCYDKGFTWDGLYEDFKRVSCWCCPLSRIGELRVLYNEYPSLWGELCRMDRYSDRRFRPDYSVEDLQRKFEKEKKRK